MAKEFTVLVSSTNEMSLNEIGELLNIIETRGIVIEEIHPGDLLAEEVEDLPDGSLYEPNDMPDLPEDE